MRTLVPSFVRRANRSRRRSSSQRQRPTPVWRRSTACTSTKAQRRGERRYFTRISTRAGGRGGGPAPDARRGRRRRHPSAGVRGRRSSRRSVGGAWPFHLGLDLCRLSTVRGHRPRRRRDDRRVVCAGGARLRLPLHGGFETMRTVVRDIPFIARRSRRGRDEARRALGQPTDTVVLACSADTTSAWITARSHEAPIPSAPDRL